MKNSFHEINRHCIRTASKIKKKKSVKLPKIREEAMPWRAILSNPKLVTEIPERVVAEQIFEPIMNKFSNLRKTL